MIFIYKAFSTTRIATCKTFHTAKLPSKVRIAVQTSNWSNWQIKRFGAKHAFLKYIVKKLGIVQEIYSGKCAVDVVDLHDRTPFIIACQYGYEVGITSSLLWR